MTYSVDLRVRVIEAYKSGEGTQKEISRVLGISISSFKRWLSRSRNNESLFPKDEGKGRPTRIDSDGMAFLKELVIKNPSITLAELSEHYYKKRKQQVGRSVLSRALFKLNLRRKKLSVTASEKNTDAVKKKQKNFLKK